MKCYLQEINLNKKFEYKGMMKNIASTDKERLGVILRVKVKWNVFY